MATTPSSRGASPTEDVEKCGPGFVAPDVASAFSNGTQDELTALLSAYPVVLFSKTSCPFAFELKRTLSKSRT